MKGGGHVGVSNLELFVVEGIEDAFVVLERLNGLGDTSVFVND